MARLYIRNFPDHLHRRLKKRARAAGRTLSAEVEVTLRESLFREEIERRVQGADHLLRSPTNAARLSAAMNRAKERKLRPSSPKALRRKLGLGGSSKKRRH